MSRLQHNIVANYVGRVWGFISAFIFVPFYLKILGVEAYGMIGFYSVLLGFLAFADAGLTATLNREFAREDRSILDKAKLLRTTEVIYWFICLFLCLAIYIGSPWIAVKWLNVAGLATEKVVFYIRLIGLAIVFQMLTSFYVGGLMGMQKQVLGNILQITLGILRSALILLPLYFFPTLETFFCWQIAITLLFVLLIRTILKKQLAIKEKVVFSLGVIASVWRYTLGMLLMSIISAVLMQLDKLMASKMLSLTHLGFYTMTATLSQLPMMIVSPLGVALLPKMTGLVTAGNSEELLVLFRKTTFIVVALAAIITFIFLAYMGDFLFLWTGEKEMVDTTTSVACLLMLGTLFQCMQLLPYYLAIANGYTKANVLLGIISVIFVIPATLVAVKFLGINGFGVVWLLMSFLTFFALSVVILKKFYPRFLFSWLVQDVAKPVFIVLSIVVLGFFLTYNLPRASWILLYAFIIGLLSVCLCIFIYHRMYPKDKVLFRLKQLMPLHKVKY